MLTQRLAIRKYLKTDIIRHYIKSIHAVTYGECLYCCWLIKYAPIDHFEIAGSGICIFPHFNENKVVLYSLLCILTRHRLPHNTMQDYPILIHLASNSYGSPTENTKF